MKPENNLDYLAATRAQSLVDTVLQDKKVTAKDLEKLLTKTLGVLQEQGVYACFLYLQSREKDNAPMVMKVMLSLLKTVEGNAESDEADSLKYAADLAQDLPRLLLAREALEQMLIYARYDAKARS
jgi:hypothetical protein